MAPFPKIAFVASQPTVNLQRRHSASSTVSNGQAAGRDVLPQIALYPTPRPSRNEHILAILAHSRGVPGQNCQRVLRGNVCQFQSTVVYLGTNPSTGARLMTKCTNCHYAADGAACGAIPLAGNAPPPPPPAAPIPAALAAPPQPVQQQEQQYRQSVGSSGISGSLYSARSRPSPEASRAQQQVRDPSLFAPQTPPRGGFSDPAEAASRNPSPSLNDVAGVRGRGRPMDPITGTPSYDRLTARAVGQVRDGRPDFEVNSSVLYDTVVDDGEVGEKDSVREAGLRDINSRAQALLRAKQVGLAQALEELEKEKLEYLKRWRGNGAWDPEDDDTTGGMGGMSLGPNKAPRYRY